jgi:hypothetical protein
MIKFKLISLLCVVMILTAILGCDFLDPTQVKNPQTTDESLAEGGTGATGPFLNGIVFRYADAVEDLAAYVDIVSDNYDNIGTFISPQADLPENIKSNDLTLNHTTSGPYFEIQELRALADFTITGVYPNDALATPDQLAELLFYRGMANVLSAENFQSAPIEENGAPLPAAQLLQLALADFAEALNQNDDSEFATRIHLARARAFRLLGDKVNAAQEANLALAGPSNFVFAAQYDAANNINSAYNFAVARALNDVQPLPRLDFLDPKYLDRDSGIPSLKIEEAHLILAEVALSDGDNAGAVQRLVDVINLANSRPRVSFRDVDPRAERPQGGAVLASPTAPAIDGLIFPRAGELVSVPTISATSLDAAAVGALTDPAEILRILYLARQEIFFYEGRRMSDLGIRLPIIELEIDGSPAINAGDAGTLVLVPGYVPAADGLDAFSIQGNNVVIAVDMNQVLADNRISPFAMPF